MMGGGGGGKPHQWGGERAGGGRRVRHVVIGSALLDVDWAADLSLLMPDSEAPPLCELFSRTPREARRAFDGDSRGVR